MTKRKLRILSLLVLALVGTFLELNKPRQNPSGLANLGQKLPPPGYVLVSEAVDGDTLRLTDGQLVRLIGIDTPETVHPKKPVQCFGQEASRFTKSLTEGAFVKLEKDISDKDQYQRLLRYVYLEDGTFLNLALVASGFAQVSTYPPDIAFTSLFLAAQTQARQNKLGLWQSCF